MRHIYAASFLLVFVLSITTQGQSQSRDDILKELRAKRAELQQLETQFLAVSDADRTSYAEFLQQQDTGLIRLLPREIYDSEVYKKNLPVLSIRGGGAYYSFSRLTHEYGYGSDIELDSDHLSVGFAGLDFGMLVNIGDVAFDQLSPNSPGARFLFAYTPPTVEPEIRIEQRRFGQGDAADEFVYKRRVPIQLNTTFLLRSISYERTDVIVAFRPIRKDSDGSVVLLWKLLKKNPAPALVRKATLN
jgi:hypothetical protein